MGLPHRELLKHARWWVAHKVKGWSLRTLARRARLEGLVDNEGRVLIEEAAPSAVAKAIASWIRCWAGANLSLCVLSLMFT